MNKDTEVTFEDMAMDAMLSLDIPEDEAEMLLDDYLTIYG